MTIKIATRGQVPPFIVMDVMRDAARLEAEGKRVVHLEVGQPSTGIPAAAAARVREMIGVDPLGYTVAGGVPELRARIAAHYHDVHGVAVDPRRVFITTGSSGAFLLGFLAAFAVGDRVALAAPGYPAYRHILTSIGVQPELIEVGADSRYQPTVVFHAAAYKHVPLMEANPLEAIRNNALATRTTAEAAANAGVERFVLISTDKAVNPQTVMGASKAMAEWTIEALGQRHPGTRFVSVRFGNVLASSGSVVPIFRSQIERGGPVTVTHPEMSRYFMTIPEAVQLVIRAGDLGGGAGEVFVLDMGEPVKIVDLAHNMIRLAGFEPDTDIAVEFTGPRPGEKLHEELFSVGEQSEPTDAKRIVRAVRSVPIEAEWVDATFERLERLVLDADEADLAALVVEIAASADRIGTSN